MQKKRLILALLAGVAMSGAAQATLIDRGGGMIYDDVLNITWLQDANYAKTSGYSADGRMSGWDQAMTWANDLVYGGYDDWRLPTMIDTGNPGCDFAFSGTDCGYNAQTVSGSTVYNEMAYMYYDNLGLKADYNPDGSPRTDSGIFSNGTFNGTDTNSFGQNDVGLIDNLQAYRYWSGLEYAPNTIAAWSFYTTDGSQNADVREQNDGYYAWAVRSGDVASVPEPATLTLLGLGLAGLGVMRRRR